MKNGKLMSGEYSGPKNDLRKQIKEYSNNYSKPISQFIDEHK
jgi:hypothetical protein